MSSVEKGRMQDDATRALSFTLTAFGRLLACACLATGCDRADDRPILEDPEEIRDRVLSASESEFIMLTDRDAIPSMVVPDTMIRVMVSEEFAEDYALVDPAVTGSEVVLPPGTLVIRQLLTTDGEPDGLTMLTVGPPTSNEHVGDLWFGVLEADGEWRQDEDGQPMYGALASCSSCHAQRGSDGFLFGVPRIER